MTQATPPAQSLLGSLGNPASATTKNDTQSAFSDTFRDQLDSQVEIKAEKKIDNDGGVAQSVEVVDAVAPPAGRISSEAHTQASIADPVPAPAVQQTFIAEPRAAQTLPVDDDVAVQVNPPPAPAASPPMTTMSHPAPRPESKTSATTTPADLLAGAMEKSAAVAGAQIRPSIQGPNNLGAVHEAPLRAASRFDYSSTPGFAGAQKADGASQQGFRHGPARMLSTADASRAMAVAVAATASNVVAPRTIPASGNVSIPHAPIFAPASTAAPVGPPAAPIAPGPLPGADRSSASLPTAAPGMAESRAMSALATPSEQPLVTKLVAPRSSVVPSAPPVDAPSIATEPASRAPVVANAMPSSPAPSASLEAVPTLPPVAQAQTSTGPLAPARLRRQPSEAGSPEVARDTAPAQARVSATFDFAQSSTLRNALPAAAGLAGHEALPGAALPVAETSGGAQATPALAPLPINGAAAAPTGVLLPPTVPSQLRVDTPVGHPSWGDAIGTRVLWGAAQGLQSATILLNPRELGPVNVTLTMNDDEASVSFVAQNPAAREAIEAALPRLRELFWGEGVSLGDVDVSDGDSRASLGGEATQEHESPAHAPADDPASGSALSEPDPQAPKSLVDTFA